MKPVSDSSTDQLQAQAGEWVFNRYSPDWTPAAEQRLQQWLAQSEDHRREYQRALQLWQRLESFKTAEFPLRQRVHSLRAKNLKRRQRAKAVRRRAGAGLLVLLAALTLPDYLGVERYRTGIGGRQTVLLADGSEMVLNTDSQASVSINGWRREIRLDRGEAYFRIAHQAERPFDVITGQLRIRDIGTGFNVIADPGATQVTVAEGEVEVHPDSRLTDNGAINHWLASGRFWLASALARPEPAGKRLKAGERIEYRGEQAAATPHSADVGKVLAWRDGRAVFELATLAEVLAQVQRYHPVVFEFETEAVKAIRVTASFDTGNLAVILNTLQATFPINIQALDGGRIVIGAAKTPA